MSKESIKAIKMVYANTTKHDWPDDIWDAIWKAVAEDAKQKQEYPFGVYGAEDLDKAWKSGYDNCKAQAMWTLEDVKKAWKSGYATAKKEGRTKETRKEGEFRTEIACLNNQLMFWKDQNQRLKEELKAPYRKVLETEKITNTHLNGDRSKT